MEEPLLNEKDYKVLEKYYLSGKHTYAQLWNAILSDRIFLNNSGSTRDSINNLHNYNFLRIWWNDNDRGIINELTEFEVSDMGKEVYESEKEKRKLYKRKTKFENKLLEASVNSNRMAPFWAGLAALFALGSIIVSVVTLTTSEKLQPSLQQIDTALQSLSQRINTTQAALERINHSIHQINADTTLVRVLKK